MRQVLLIVLAIATWCTTSIGQPFTEEFHSPDQSTQADPAWPDGLVEVVNLEGRVRCVTSRAEHFRSDMFMFAGNNDAFNRFLKKYSRIQSMPLTVTLHATFQQNEDAEPVGAIRNEFDWRIHVIPPPQMPDELFDVADLLGDKS